MSKFSSGQNIEDSRSAKWVSSSMAFAGHVVRMAVGTSDAAEYTHAAADLPWGVLVNDGTLNNQLVVATDGVLQMRNSINGTVNIGDPIIVDYANSGGTTGFVRSAYTTEAIADIAAGGDVGTFIPTRVPLSNKAVPGSIRWSGTNSFLVLGASGTNLLNVLTTAFGGGNFFYTIDQPVLGYSMEKATTPNQLFKVETYKERFIKNNIVN